MLKLKSLPLLLIFLCALVMLTSCSKQNEGNQNTYIKETFAYTNPFTGEGLNELALRPVCVSIDNQAGARMQSGLNQADLVYEVPAEGGISRYLAVYFSGEAAKIGPVRSARPYLIDIARGWQGVFIHCGGSPDAYSYLKKGVVDSIDEISWSKGFWRDKARKAPHNLYTSTPNLWEQIEKKDYGIQKEIMGFKFDSEAATVTGTLAQIVKLPYSGGKISFTYDAATGRYLRSVRDTPYTDNETGERLSADNIIIQQVNSKMLDSVGRLEIDLLGSGSTGRFRI